MYHLVHQHVIGVGIVTDISMRPTLEEGNTYLVNKYLYRFRRPSRGDIVVLRKTTYLDEQYVKRVVGLEGEVLAVRNGRVFINGRVIEEPYAVGVTLPPMAPYPIPLGDYFLLGDNRLTSQDSRHFGTVSIRNIEGLIRPGTLFPFH